MDIHGYSIFLRHHVPCLKIDIIPGFGHESLLNTSRFNFLIEHVHCLVNIILPGRKQRSQAQEWIQYMACDRFYFCEYTFFNLTTCFDNTGYTVSKYKKVKRLTS